MKFEIYKDSKRQWRWRIRSKNGKIIGASQDGFKNKSNAVRTCEQVSLQGTLQLAINDLNQGILTSETPAEDTLAKVVESVRLAVGILDKVDRRTVIL